MNTISVTEIAEYLRGLAERLDLDLDGVEITGESSLESDLEMDSLNLMDFLVLLERKYDVKIGDERLREVDTVADVAELLNGLMNPVGSR
jgi:acyl carrier protein